jgi:hypothetical protein
MVHRTSPLDHLDRALTTQLKKGSAARDALLLKQSVPAWLLCKPQDIELGEASPSLIQAGKAMASPLGLAPEHLPELVALVWEGYGANTSYTHEVQRFLRMVDFMVRVCAPLGLEYFQRPELARMLREAPAIRDDETFYTLYTAVLDVTRLLGDARLFEARATDLSEALRVRTVGFGVVAIKHAQTAIESGFDPRETVPEMRGLHLRFLPVLAGARSLPGQSDTVDRAALALYRDLVQVDAQIYAEPLARLQARLDKSAREPN